MTRDGYVDLVERRYFGNVAQADIPAVVACFTDDALVTIYHGDAAPRLFKAQPGAGETPLPRFFEHLLANYDPQFTEFVHYVDTGGERCAATFLVTLTPKPDSPYRDAGVQRLRNCNFFRCRDGLIHEMTIYTATPAPQAARRPTAPAPPAFLKPSPHHGAMHGVRRLRHSFASCGARTSGPRRAR